MLGELRNLITLVEASGLEKKSEVDTLAPEYRESALNLLHYMTLRSMDLSSLQMRLQRSGLSSLGRAEGQVLASLKQVEQRLAESVLRREESRASLSVPVDWIGSAQRLEANSSAIFGPIPAKHRPYIMVTAADAVDEEGIRLLMEAGMNCLRVNCAHGAADEWRKIVKVARQVSLKCKRELRIFMDLPGPKIRTGPMEPGPQVLKASPRRNALGQTIDPVSLLIGNVTQAGVLGVSEEFKCLVKPGDTITLTDTRERRRVLNVVPMDYASLRLTCDRTIYLGSDTVLVLVRGDKEVARTPLLPPPCRQQKITLTSGDEIILTATQTPGHPTERDPTGKQTSVPHIGCTLPQALADVKVGETVCFDDGKFRGVVIEKKHSDLLIKIIAVQGQMAKLGAEKGINFPDSHVGVCAITDADLLILKVAVELADGVELSFIHRGEDVRRLRQELIHLGRREMPIILKIETNQGFKNLPRLILEAMHQFPVGVMIARGDLAVECGFERLAELQEEIMWICEAAHLPVIWATQVLESLAQNGVPTRAEVSDAAMSARAECVMLNKGPYIVQAVSTLAKILEKMQRHQSKKRSLLDALHFSNHKSLGV